MSKWLVSFAIFEGLVFVRGETIFADSLSQTRVTSHLPPSQGGRGDFVSAVFLIYFDLQGTATSVLHYGPKITDGVDAKIHFADGVNEDTYQFSLAHASADRIVFTDESVIWHRVGHDRPLQVSLGVGHMESQIRNKSQEGDRTCQVMYRILRNCQVYQFHDTSPESRIRNPVDLANEHFLYSDGGNLATYLYAMKQSEAHEKQYDRIVHRIRDIVPQFGDFAHQPSAANKNYITLNWREANGSDYLFGPHQMSYSTVKKDIEFWMREQNRPECRFTAMFDLHALPEEFPGYDEAKRSRDPYRRVKILEEALAQDISDTRFIPYIQLHEFEALILAVPSRLSLEYLDNEAAIGRLAQMARGKNPELIDDAPQTAPSKRILQEIPEYSKNIAGPNVAAAIGLDTLTKSCRHFAEWIARLEALDNEP